MSLVTFHYLISVIQRNFENGIKIQFHIKVYENAFPFVSIVKRNLWLRFDDGICFIKILSAYRSGFLVFHGFSQMLKEKLFMMPG